MTATAGPATSGGILVVDDTPENIAVLTAVLKERGHRVRAVPNGALALRAAAKETPELVLLDVTMPGMDGFEVCRRLKASPELREVPVIFLSALSDTLDKVNAFSVGGVDYVTKPFQVEELSARVETHLANRRLQVEVEQGRRELERSYADLKRLESARQALVGMIVHDLKNPVTGIQLNAGLVRDNAGLAGELRLAIDDVCAASETMGRMILDVLDVAGSEEARLRPRLAPLSVRELLERAAKQARAAADSAGKRLTVEVAPDLPLEILGDGELLRRLVDNLVDNSLKYAPGGTEVRLSASPAGDERYRLAVHDQGPGVPPERREAIFEPFARLERDAETHARVSRGLGLAFCRLAAEAHHGSIRVEDGGHGGSTFVVLLPLDPAGMDQRVS